MSFAVRPVTSADAPALAALLNAVIRAGGTTALESEFTPEALDAAYLTGPTVHCCHVAEVAAGALAAFQTLVRYPGLPEDIGDIATFAALDRRQSGAGTALFAATTARARELGLSAINATIRADNTGGLAFYTKQGFADHGVTPAVPLADGIPMDRVHKRFSLSEGKKTSPAIDDLISLARSQNLASQSGQWSAAFVQHFDAMMPEAVRAAGLADSTIEYFQSARSPHNRADEGFIDRHANVALSFLTEKPA